MIDADEWEWEIEQAEQREAAREAIQMEWDRQHPFATGRRRMIRAAMWRNQWDAASVIVFLPVLFSVAGFAARRAGREGAFVGLVGFAALLFVIQATIVYELFELAAREPYLVANDPPAMLRAIWLFAPMAGF